jgi:hypothetical protein
VIGIDIGKNSVHVVGRSARRDRAAAEMVARPGRGATCLPAAVPDQLARQGVREDETTMEIGLPGACEHW